MKLYTFWRSLATFRVRIALNLKGIAVDTETVDLMAGAQKSPEYQAINPQMSLPTLRLDDGTALFQSMAILEYLEEAYPRPALLPVGTAARARVRALAQIAVADGHPIVTPRVRGYLTSEFGATPEQMTAWGRHWTGVALAAFEGHLARDAATGRYCHGDTVTLADVCLASQVVGHSLFGGNPADFPTVARIHATCMALDAFDHAHPLKQPGAPAA